MSELGITSLSGLASKYGLSLPSIFSASENARAQTEKISGLLSKAKFKLLSSDTSLVIFGSLARGEWTSGSDLDWTLLVDGQADSGHLGTAQEIADILREQGFKSPGRTELFGNIAFSHELIHQIGGEQDTNRNTTQRILLLLESLSIAGQDADAHARVTAGILKRYLDQEPYLLTQQEKRFKVPRFLLNDIVRFWRTMAVDFANKQRARQGDGWGLRNFKLALSRKMIFTSGLLLCFECQLNDELNASIPSDPKEHLACLLNHLKAQVRIPPLQRLGRSLASYEANVETVKKILDSYDAFLRTIDSPDTRMHLGDVRPEAARTDDEFIRARGIAKRFEEGLEEFFFENSRICGLTRKYGVF